MTDKEELEMLIAMNERLIIVMECKRLDPKERHELFLAKTYLRRKKSELNKQAIDAAQAEKEGRL